MIAVAVAVIAGVVAVTCGIVADSNHADSLTFLGVMVKTTAAQIFLTGAICTWALFAALWLLSVGARRSKQRTLELRALRAGYHSGHDDAGLDRALTAPAAQINGGHRPAGGERFVDDEPTLTEDGYADDGHDAEHRWRRRSG